MVVRIEEVDGVVKWLVDYFFWVVGVGVEGLMVMVVGWGGRLWRVRAPERARSAIAPAVAVAQLRVAWMREDGEVVVVEMEAEREVGRSSRRAAARSMRVAAMAAESLALAVGSLMMAWSRALAAMR